MQYLDRIQDTSVTGGTSTLTLSGTPPSGFRAFSLLTTGISNIPYVATQGAAYEIGIGTLVTSSTFSRDTILVSSNANNAVNFAASTITIFNDIPSAEILKLISTAATIVTSVASQASSTIVMIESGVAKQITVNNLLNSIGLTASGLSPAAALSGSDIVVISQDGGVTEVRTTLAALAAYVLTSGYTGSSAGLSVVAGVGRSLFTAVGSASGIGSASAVAPASGNIASSSGTSTVAAVGASVAESVGASSGVTSASGVASSGAPAYLFSPTAYTFNNTTANITTNGFKGDNSSAIYVKTAGGVTPANVKMGWSKSSTVAPAVYADTTLQANNGTGTGLSLTFTAATRTGGWTQGGSTGQSFYGLYGAGSLYAKGTAGTYYLWIITDDGFSKCYDNNTGTPIGWVLT